MPRRDYRSLGGWLLFFTISLGLGFGMNLISFLEMIAWGGRLDPVDMFLTAASVVLEGVMLYQVLARRQQYRQVIVALTVVFTLTDVYALLSLSLYDVLLSAVILSFVRNIIWVVYFFRSKRVAVYFGQSAQPFGMDETRHCPYCGNRVSEDAIFCGRCGRPLRR